MAPFYYSQRAVFASLSAFFIRYCATKLLLLFSYYYVVLSQYVRDRQTSGRQTSDAYHRLMPPPYGGVGITSCAGGRHNVPGPCKLTFKVMSVIIMTFCHNLYATDRRQTDVRRASSLNASALWGHEHNRLCGRPPQYDPAHCKLTFDLLTLKVMSVPRVTWATFLGLSVLDLGPMYNTNIAYKYKYNRGLRSETGQLLDK